MMATIEHTNVTVRDRKVSVAWMQEVFDWRTRWEARPSQVASPCM